jgi:hypothetical protein
MSFRRNEEKEKREKMVLITGTVMIFITALLGTQLIVEGRVYSEKVEYLEKKGYTLDNSLKWDEYDQWKQSEILDLLKGKYETRAVQSGTWQDWKDALKKAEGAAVYDGSLWGEVYHCNQTYTIWFHSIDSRKKSGIGEVTTYFVMPDLVPENNEG